MSLTDAFPSARFFVEIDGVTRARFQQCSGIEMQTEVMEYQEGGLNSFVHKLPGRTKFSNLTLKWGSTDTTDLWDWYLRLAVNKQKKPQKKNVSVIQFNPAGVEVRRWNLVNAYPVKWTGPSFDANSTEVGVETLELAYDEFKFVKAAGGGNANAGASASASASAGISL